jgi:hypothetical protein
MGLLTRPRGVFATLEGSTSTSASTHAPYFDMMDEVLVAAAEYKQCEGNTSMMSGPSSYVSFPSRGWASVVASVQGDPASLVVERARGCHVCFRRDHFLMDCPLLPPGVRQAIVTQRTQQIQQDRVVLPSRVNPPSLSLSAILSPVVLPLAPLRRFRDRRTYPPQPGVRPRAIPTRGAPRTQPP